MSEKLDRMKDQKEKARTETTLLPAPGGKCWSTGYQNSPARPELIVSVRARGMLESFLICPGELADDQVMELLKLSFRQQECCAGPGQDGSRFAGSPERSNPNVIGRNDYTVPVQLRSCRRLDVTGLAFRSPSRFHSKENCIFLALLRSYPFAALAQAEAFTLRPSAESAQPNTIPDRLSRAIYLDGRSFCLGGDAYPLPPFSNNNHPAQQGTVGSGQVLPTRAARSCFRNTIRKTKNYSGKRGILYTEIMLPAHAPPEYASRETLWNSVEAAEKQWNAQLARRFVLALPKESRRSSTRKWSETTARNILFPRG